MLSRLYNSHELATDFEEVTVPDFLFSGSAYYLDIDLFNVESNCDIEIILWYNSGAKVLTLNMSLFQ